MGFLSTENIRLKHLVGSDSSDSEDESQKPKGKEKQILVHTFLTMHACLTLCIV